MPRRPVSRALVAAASVSVLAACGTPYDMDDFTRPEPEVVETVDVGRLPPPPEPDPPAGPWRCHYSPTMDYDWHNDVLCDNGVEAHRPYLLEWDDFVTEDELMEAAFQYEAALNAAEPVPAPPKENEPVWSLRPRSG